MSARRSLFWRTERRTGRYTAVKGRRQRGGADWLGSGVTESHSRSEQNKEGYEQARDFHLLAPCRSGGYGLSVQRCLAWLDASFSSCRDYRKRNWENQPVKFEWWLTPFTRFTPPLSTASLAEALRRSPPRARRHSSEHRAARRYQSGQRRAATRRRSGDRKEWSGFLPGRSHHS